MNNVKASNSSAIKGKDENIVFSFDLLSKELKDEVFSFYNVSEELFNNSEELYSFFYALDNAEFFLQALNKNIMDLVVGNLLDNFIKAHEKELNEPKTRNNPDNPDHPDP